MSNPNEFQTVWPELNKALALSGPLTRGKFGLIGGFTHGYKTGLLTDLFYQMCTGKTAVPTSPQRTPKIMYITVDEPDSLLMKRLINYAYVQNNLPRLTEERDLERDDIEFLTQTLNERGYDAGMFVLPPSEPMTVGNLISIISGQITEDSEVHAVFVDGLDQLNREPASDHASALEALQAFVSKENILLMGTHQLSVQAMVHRREGHTGHELLNLLYRDTLWVSGGERIANLVDVEILMYLHMDHPKVDILCGSHKQGMSVLPDDGHLTISIPSK